MANFTRNARAVEELGRELVTAGFAPFVCAPSDALSPLHEALDAIVGMLDVPRDDNAIAIAAGVSLAGGFPAVLLQNSGPGGCADVIASVIARHEVPMLLIVAIGGTGPDASDPAMVRLSEQVLDEFGIQSVPLDPTMPAAAQIEVVRAIVLDELRPAALLLPDEALRRPA
jgi:sulfopyruvate decarboxylase subunit alpha